MPVFNAELTVGSVNVFFSWPNGGVTLNSFLDANLAAFPQSYHFRVFRGETNARSSAVDISGPITAAGFLDTTTVSDLRDYYYWVNAYDAGETQVGGCTSVGHVQSYTQAAFTGNWSVTSISTDSHAIAWGLQQNAKGSLFTYITQVLVADSGTFNISGIGSGNGAYQSTSSDAAVSTLNGLQGFYHADQGHEPVTHTNGWTSQAAPFYSGAAPYTFALNFHGGVDGASSNGTYNLQVAWTFAEVVTSGPPTLYLVPTCIGATYTSFGQIVRPATPQEAGTQSGPAQGKLRRMTYAAPLLYATQGISHGVDASMRVIPLPTAGGGGLLTKLQLFSGVYQGTVDATDNYDNMWGWQVTRPYPCTVVSVECQLETSENL